MKYTVQTGFESLLVLMIFIIHMGGKYYFE